MRKEFKIPIHLSIITIDYYSERGNNQYKEFSLKVKGITKGYNLKDCEKRFNTEKHELSKLRCKVSKIEHIVFLSRGVF